MLEIQAVEDNKLVLAYTATNNTVQVQSYSILDGVGATTNDISHELTVAGFNAGNVAPSISGTTIDDLAVHALLDEVDEGPARRLTTFTELDTATPQAVLVPTNLDADSLHDATLLENGNRVVVLDTNGQGASSVDTELRVDILAPDGTQVSRFEIDPEGGELVSQPQVTALVGGRFVVSMRAIDPNGDRDVVYQVFEADGTPLDTQTRVVFNTQGVIDFNDEPEILALDDGGFVVLFVTDNGESRILGRRYDADGVELGDVFTVDTQFGDGIGVPQATLLDDGLVAITYTNGGNLQLSIVATEALDVVLTDADEAITGTIEADIIDGAGGDDTINGNDGDDIICGGAGNDTITGSSGADFDVAIYLGVFADYDITFNENGSVTVRDINVADGDEGRDVLTNVEQLQFADTKFDLLI
ncbi:calcium-binding protein [Pseudahrensia aquimaris]|uniref:Calcium-binding protein n=1 Tax=Pseudahrensia aquimaris TaxID=744461 RepID=A0ABW3FGR8_9HYPH